MNVTVAAPRPLTLGRLPAVDAKKSPTPPPPGVEWGGGFYGPGYVVN